MEKENSIYRALLERYEHVVSEQYFINQDNTITNIDIGLLGDINYYIQVKHGNSVNTTQALKAFCYDCMILDKRPNIKIWYSEFPINDKAFHNICRRENIAICKDFDSLIQLINLPKKKQNQVQLRDYQIKAIENVLNNTQLSGIIVFPPGCGKTITALEICEALYHKEFKKIVWTTRRKELLLGGFNDMTNYKEMPVYNYLTKNGKYNNPNSEGLHIMNHELFMKLLTHKEYKKPDYIVVDECHETGATEIYNTLRTIQVPMLGLSATPYTGNMEHQNNVRRLFPKIFAELNIFDAIAQGYALPLEFVFNSDPLSAIKTVKAELPWFKAIAWCTTIEGCDSYAEILANHFPELKIFSSHSKNDSINGNIMEFKNCLDDCILVCVNKAREGWNDPRINCAIHLDEVQNRAFNVSIQTGNRANRTYPGKTRAIVIDCVNRDPIDVIMSYYFAYNPRGLFKEISNKLRQEGSIIYYGSTKLFEIAADFNTQFTITDYVAEIQTRIFGETEYQKFIDMFQAYLFTLTGWEKIPASFDSYLTLIKDRNDFLPNPQLEFPHLSWAEVFGKPMREILGWSEFKAYCMQQYKLNPGKTDLVMFYKELFEKNNLLPENPSDAYKEFRNFPDLFGCRNHWR